MTICVTDIILLFLFYKLKSKGQTLQKKCTLKVTVLTAVSRQHCGNFREANVWPGLSVITRPWVSSEEL